MPDWHAIQCAGGNSLSQKLECDMPQRIVRRENVQARAQLRLLQELRRDKVPVHGAPSLRRVGIDVQQAGAGAADTQRGTGPLGQRLMVAHRCAYQYQEGAMEAGVQEGGLGNTGGMGLALHGARLVRLAGTVAVLYDPAMSRGRIRAGAWRSKGLPGVFFTGARPAHGRPSLLHHRGRRILFSLAIGSP